MENIPTAVKGVSLSLMGSQSTGLADPISDVDLKVNVLSLEQKSARGPSTGIGRPENRNLVRRKLAQVSKYLRGQGFKNHVIIAHANNPLLKVRHAASGVDFQIVFSQSTSTQEVIIRQLMDEHPQLKDVFMVLKAALAARRLNEPAIGGLGSYPLFMLVAAGLKRGAVPVRADHFTALKRVVHRWARDQTEVHCFQVGVNIYQKGKQPSQTTRQARRHQEMDEV